MRKPIAVLVAGVFALTASSVFAASHTGGKMDDKKTAVVPPSDATPPATKKAPPTAKQVRPNAKEVPKTGEGAAASIPKDPANADKQARPAAKEVPKTGEGSQPPKK